MLSRPRRSRRASPAAAPVYDAAAPTAPNVPDPAAVAELLQLARQSFVQLQAAWDRGDMRAIAVLASEPLLQDLRDQLQLRGPAVNCTEVLQLDARLLALEELHEAFVASVEFSGLIRERFDGSAAPFRELWLLANIKAAGCGWQLARVQSLS